MIKKQYIIYNSNKGACSECLYTDLSKVYSKKEAEEAVIYLKSYNACLDLKIKLND